MINGGARGRLRIYLGAAPGVGKTYAMLSEGRRRAERGTDVVIAVVETHGRAQVAQLVGDMEEVSRLPARDDCAAGMAVDLDAVIARRPGVVLVDDLARSNPSGSRNAARWQDIEEILGAGIDVISTVNIEHLESLNDVVESITGVKQQQTVPDDVVRNADQVELVDMTPEALRRRMAHGNIYRADSVDAALSRYFRIGNLAALRELALLWLADRVDERLDRYRRDHEIESTWAARERVVVAVSGGPESDTLLRRGARIASRGAGGELHAVFVAGSKRDRPAPQDLAQLRVLTEELGGRHHTVTAEDVAEAVLQFARGLNATQIVLGVSRRSPRQRLFALGVSDRIVVGSGDIDVLMVTHPYARGAARTRFKRTALGTPRMAAGWLLALVGPPLVVAASMPTREPTTLPLAAMLLLAMTVVCALVGGLWPALTAALAGSLLLNWFFTPPHGTLTISDAVNVVALGVFLLLAAAVASVVDKAARRSVQANLARHEADTLTMLNRTLLRSDHDVLAILRLVCDNFGVRAASLLRRSPEDSEWETVAATGTDPPTRPEDADADARVSASMTLTLRGDPLPPEDMRVLAAFATHLAVVLERQELAYRASTAQQLEESNKIRTALLAAVSHDLRTPLAGIKAAVSSLRSPEVRWSAEDESELLGAIEDSADRLHTIVANLLDLSRLQLGAVQVVTDQIGLDDVVSRTIADMPSTGNVTLRMPPGTPAVRGDAGLLDRIVANLIENALRHAPPTTAVEVAISNVGDRVQLHVVDHGPGVPDLLKPRMFEPFRRLGDAHARDGVGLGLAVAKGLTEALGGHLNAEDTPGGGLTMIVDLPAALAADQSQPDQVGA